MNILAIDTATEACSVALTISGGTSHIFELCPQQHSQKVLGMVDDLLTKANVKLNELDAIAFGVGPGSFTGVRIATGIVQGLAFGANLPVIGVSTLATMAQECFEKFNAQEVAVLIDARMSEVYFGDYKIENSIAVPQQPEAVLPPSDALNKFGSKNSNNQNTLFFAGTGWEAYSEVLTFDSVSVLYPNAKYMLPLAKQAFSAGLQQSPISIQPVYLRDNVTWKKLPGK